MNRRNLLMTGASGVAGVAAAPLLHAAAWAETLTSDAQTSTMLTAVTRTLEINGKSAKVFGLVRNGGAPGISLQPGQDFRVALTNSLAEPTLIHWHGLTPPWPMDGVPDMPAPLMKPGETRIYAFPVSDPGTYWIHAHTLQEQNLLAAPLIVHSAADAGKDEQEVVVLLHDFSFTPAEQLLVRLTKGAGKSGMSMAGMDMGSMAEAMVGKSHEDVMKHMAQMRGMNSDAMMGGMDLNDIDYDAYLANDRTLDDPEVIRVEANGRVRLRIINGAAATNFAIDTGRLHGQLIAVDGQNVEPIAGSTFPIAMLSASTSGSRSPKRAARSRSWRCAKARGRGPGSCSPRRTRRWRSWLSKARPRGQSSCSISKRG